MRGEGGKKEGREGEWGKGKDGMRRGEENYG